MLRAMKAQKEQELEALREQTRLMQEEYDRERERRERERQEREQQERERREERERRQRQEGGKRS